MSESSARAGLPAELLLDPDVVDEPYAFYRTLVEEAPVWGVPGAEIVVVSSFAAVTEATNRVDDFSSNIRSLIYRGDRGTPQVIAFSTDENVHAWRPRTRPCTRRTAGPCSPSSLRGAWPNCVPMSKR